MTTGDECGGESGRALGCPRVIQLASRPSVHPARFQPHQADVALSAGPQMVKLLVSRTQVRLHAMQPPWAQARGRGPSRLANERVSSAGS